MAGRDADTVAAMLGNLLGALHAPMPSLLGGLDNLEDHGGLVELADRLYGVAPGFPSIL